MKTVKSTRRENRAFSESAHGSSSDGSSCALKPANDPLPNMASLSEAEISINLRNSLLSKTEQNKMLIRRRKKSQHPLRYFRVQRGLTLQELADLSGLSPSYLSRLEGGSRRLNADVMHSIASILSCAPGDLLPSDNIIRGERGSTFCATTATSSYTDLSSLNIADLPFQLFAANEEKNLSFKITLDPEVEWVNRPNQLYGKTGAFAFMVNIACCSNKYDANDIIFADPSDALFHGCYAVIISKNGDAYVGRYIFENGKKFIHVHNHGAEPCNIMINDIDVDRSYKLVGTANR